MLNRITQGDCLKVMKQISDDSVDMILTSPPYDDLRTYNGYSFDFLGISMDMHRVLKPGGVIIWVVGDATRNGSETGTSFRQALRFMELGLNLHDTMLYHKVNYVPLTHRRYEQAFEYMFCFSKGSPNTFNAIKIPCKLSGGRSHSGKFYHTPDAKTTTTAHKIAPIGESKIAPNIFSYTIGKVKNGHPAVFPIELALDQVSSWTNPGDLVLDPFSGSGTTAIACLQTDRNFIGLEISPEYVSIANKRIEDWITNLLSS